jgi:queuosine precursor transporter
MPFSSRKNRLLYIFWGFFVANAVIAELISVKLFDAGEAIGLTSDKYIMAMGLLPWPIVFVATDLMNEFYGKKIVRTLSIVTSCLLLYVFLIIYIVQGLPAWEVTGVQDEAFANVYGQSGYLIFGSIAAFLFGQFIDITMFGLFKKWTGGKYIWLRTTGSTLISQLFDTMIVIGVGLYMSGILKTADEYFYTVLTGYTIKVCIAILVTPLIYLGHFVLRKYFSADPV